MNADLAASAADADADAAAAAADAVAAAAVAAVYLVSVAAAYLLIAAVAVDFVCQQSLTCDFCLLAAINCCSSMYIKIEFTSRGSWFFSSQFHTQSAVLNIFLPRKHKTLNQCWFNVCLRR